MALTVDPPRSGPCAAWANIADVSSCGCCSDLDKLDQDLLERNLTIASEILFRKSGMQFPGECSATLRPCCVSELCSNDDYRWIPRADIVEGRWYNVGPNRTCIPWDCATQMPRVDLGEYPVTEITEVKIGGAVLAQSSYRLDWWRYLVRIDGEQWPTSQNLLAEDTEVDTWSAAIKFGQPPPDSGVQAVANLGCELTKHCMGDQKCSLPLRVTQINRQGITYSLPDVMDVLDRGKTGLYYVDLFLDTYNPEGLTRPPRVLSPDLPSGPRRLGSQ